MTHLSSPPRWMLTGFALLMLLPLLLVRYLPLMDYANHVARFHLLAHHDQLPYFSSYFRVAWQWVPNLGTDIIAQVLATFLSTDNIENLIIVIILLVQFGGVVALSRAIHAAPQWGVFFALPLSYSYILMNGFANYLLAQGFMLLGLACWVRLSPHQPLLAALASIPIAFVIFISQGFAFGLYGLLLGAYEVECWWRSERQTFAPLLRRLARLLPQTIVVLPALLYGPLLAAPRADRVATYGQVWQKSADTILARAVAEAGHRLELLLRVIDSSWLVMDIAIMLLLILTAVTLLRRGFLTIAPGWQLPLLLLVMAYVLMPPALLGVGAVADRLPLAFWLLFAACTRFTGPPQRFVRVMVGTALLVMLTTLVAWQRSSAVTERLVADAAFLPAGATMTVVRESSGRPERAMPLPRCTPLLHHLAWTRGVVTPLFTNGDQQPLGVTPEYIRLFHQDLTGKRSVGAADPQQFLWHRFVIDAQRGIDYLLICNDDVPFVVPPAPWVKVTASPDYRIYRNQQSGSQHERSAL